MPIRTLRPEDVDTVVRMHRLAFAVDADPTSWYDAAGRDHVWVLDEEGPRAVLIDVPMGRFLGGGRLEDHGVAGVAVAPEDRGRGFASRLMVEWLRGARERGAVLSSLFASTGRLYAGVGFGKAVWWVDYEASIHAFRGGTREPAVRRITPADREAIAADWTRWAAPIHGALDRGPYVWDRCFRVRSGGDPVDGWVVDGPDGVEGWLTARVVRDAASPGDQILEIRDVQAWSERAARRLVGLVGSFGTLVRTVRWHGRLADPLVAVLPEHRFHTPGPREPGWIRVLDVAAALAQRGYARGLTARLTLTVDDPVFDDNTGRVTLTVGGGEGTVARGGEGGLALGVGALATLLTGYATATDLARTGRVRGTPEDLAVADAVFAGTPSWGDFY